MSNTRKIKALPAASNGRPGVQVQGRADANGTPYVALTDPLANQEFRFPLEVALGVAAAMTNTVLALMQAHRDKLAKQAAGIVLPGGR